MASRPTLATLDATLLEDDSDDEDVLLKDYTGHSVFNSQGAHTKDASSLGKKEGNAIGTLPSPPSAGHSASLNMVSLRTNHEQGPTPLRNDQVEAQAQAIVKDLTLHAVSTVDDISLVGWRKTAKVFGNMARKLKGVPYYFYPCRCLSVDQARLLFSRPLGNHKIAVQYLGWNWSGASTNEAIAKSTFLPLGGTTHDDTLLHAFLDQQFGTSPDTAVERRTEELVIRASWQRVREKQATKDKARLEVDTPHSTAPVLHSRDKMNAGYDSSGSGDDGHIRDETAEYEGLTQKRAILRPGDTIRYYDPIGVAGNNQWLRETKIIGVDPKNKHFPLNLLNGEHLHRDHPILRVAKMHGKKLISDDTVLGYRSISRFGLRTAGTKRMEGLKNKVQQFKKARRSLFHASNVCTGDRNNENSKCPEHSQHDNPEKQDTTAKDAQQLPEASNNPTGSEILQPFDNMIKGAAVNRKRRLSSTPDIAKNDSKKHPHPAYVPPAIKRQRKSLLSQSQAWASQGNMVKSVSQRRSDKIVNEPRISSVCPISLAKTDLQAAIYDVQSSTGRRYKPHMTIEQLRVGLATWDKISAMVDSTRKLEEIVADLSETLEVSHRMLTRFLRGDRNRPWVLSERKISEISTKLQGWLSSCNPSEKG